MDVRGEGGWKRKGVYKREEWVDERGKGMKTLSEIRRHGVQDPRASSVDCEGKPGLQTK